MQKKHPWFWLQVSDVVVNPAFAPLHQAVLHSHGLCCWPGNGQHLPINAKSPELAISHINQFLSPSLPLKLGRAKPVFIKWD